jgi:peptidoglycan/LPS O-acetylase OafA/YrhL
MAIPKNAFGQLCEARRNNFDFLRFALATLVIVSHAKMTEVPDTGDHQVRFLGLGGRLAVNCFFAISGFLISNSWQHSRGLVDYTRKRFLRIYPGLVSALLFCVAVVGPLGGAELRTYFRDQQTYRFFAPLLLQANQTLPGVFAGLPHAREVNGPVWTIRYEIACYVLLGLLGMVGLLRRRGAVLALFLASLAVFTAQVSRWPVPWCFHLPYFGILDHLLRLVAFFLAGVVFYFYRDSIPFSRAWLAASLAVLALTYKVIPSVTVPVFGTYVLFYLAFSPLIRLHGFARYGDFSYGLYLYAWPVQQLLIQHFGARLAMGHGLDRLALSVLTFGLTLPLAAASWYVVERPFLRLKSRPLPGSVAVVQATFRGAGSAPSPEMPAL